MQHTTQMNLYASKSMLFEVWAMASYQIAKYLLPVVEINFQTQDGAASALGVTSANQNLDNFHVPVNALRHLKCRISRQPTPNAKPNLGSILISLLLLTPNKVDSVTSANQIFSIFLFLVLYFLSYKNILPSTLFCSSPSGDCLLHEVLNKGCL